MQVVPKGGFGSKVMIRSDTLILDTGYESFLEARASSFGCVVLDKCAAAFLIVRRSIRSIRTYFYPWGNLEGQAD